MTTVPDGSGLLRALASARSALFVPANDERKWARALDSGADAVILDLEDAIVFSPSEQDIESAHEVVAAFAAAVADGSGVIPVNGKMVDAPLVLKAERILSLASAVQPFGKTPESAPGVE